MSSMRVLSFLSRHSLLAMLLLLHCGFVGGCSTLSSLGLPFGSSNNVILKSASRISDAPGQSFLLPKELARQTLDSYVVEVGDSILIEPVRFDSTIRLPGDQIVQPDGHVSIGEFGSYAAVNKTIEQIELEVQLIINERIRADMTSDKPLGLGVDSSNYFGDAAKVNAADPDELERRIDESIRQNRISARLISWDSKVIYVLGEVNSPGSFNYTGNQTVLDAVLEAGGLTGKANHHEIIVSRPTPCSSCRVVMKVCYDQIVQLGDASTNYQLQPGDRVFVASLTFVEDLKKSLRFCRDKPCPRCADCQQGCILPAGCE